MDGPFSSLFEGKMHIWDLGLLVLGPLLLVATVWGVLDAPRRPEGERLWLRRLRLLALATGAVLYALALLAIWSGVRAVRALGPRCTGADLAAAWAHPILRAALAWLFVVGCILAAGVVVLACRKGRTAAAVLAGAPLALAAVAYGLLHQSRGPNPLHRGLIVVPLPDSAESIGPVFGFLLLLGAIGALVSLLRLVLAGSDGERRAAARRHCFAFGLYVTASAVLAFHLIALQELALYALLGPRAPVSLPAFLWATVGGARPMQVMGGIGVLALGLGLPVLHPAAAKEE